MNNKIENDFFEHFKSIKESSLNGKKIYKFEGDEFVDKDIFKDENFKDTSLHLDLLPQPFIGDIKNAKIIICSLNPGYSDEDCYIEDEKLAKEKGYKYYGKELLSQVNPEAENKTLFWLTEKPDEVKNLSGGAKWWRKKLNQNSKKASLVYYIAQKYNNKNPEDKIEAVFEWLSNNMAAIELFPYHSKSFKESLLKECESTKIIKEYVHKVLIPEAKEGKRLICFTRSFRLWGKDGKSVSDIADGKYVICSPNPRCVTFNVGLDFGKRIFDYICKHYEEFKPLNEVE